MKNQRLTALLFSKWVAFLAIGVSVFLVVKLGQVAYKSYETNKEIGQLKKTVGELEENQKRLESLNSFLATDFFAEKEARLKLGMQKEGEHVVVIAKGGGEARSAENAKSGVAALKEEQRGQKKNPGKWWDYFFGVR